MKRRALSFNGAGVAQPCLDSQITHSNFVLRPWAILDTAKVTCIMKHAKPDERYNPSAMDQAAIRFQKAGYTSGRGWVLYKLVQLSQSTVSTQFQSRCGNF